MIQIMSFLLMALVGVSAQANSQLLGKWVSPCTNEASGRNAFTNTITEFSPSHAGKIYGYVFSDAQCTQKIADAGTMLFTYQERNDTVNMVMIIRGQNYQVLMNFEVVGDELRMTPIHATVDGRPTTAYPATLKRVP